MSRLVEPLGGNGFMNEADWRGACLGMRLESGETLAIMEVTENYASDKALKCEHVYRTTDTAHPGVAKVLAQRHPGAGRLSGP